MEQIEIGNIERSTKFDQYTREQLISQNQALESELARAIKEVYRIKYQDLTDEQLELVLKEHLFELRREIFGSSSERYKKPQDKPKKEEPAKPRIKRPSERYPNVPIREVHIGIAPAPSCDACGKELRAHLGDDG